MKDGEICYESLDNNSLSGLVHCGCLHIFSRQYICECLTVYIHAHRENSNKCNNTNKKKKNH